MIIFTLFRCLNLCLYRYEGPGYYNFATAPPLSVFPHTVEGSLTDINDDQFNDQGSPAVRLLSLAASAGATAAPSNVSS